MEREESLSSAASLKAPAVLDYRGLLAAIANSHELAQRHVAQTANTAITYRNWLIGCYIVEFEQNGHDRAEYGSRLLKCLSTDLQTQLGKGFKQRNLELFRAFYSRYSIAKSLISQFNLQPPTGAITRHENRLEWQDDEYFGRLFRELSWSHFVELARIDDDLKRAFYEVETLKNRWSLRELKRQIAAMLYERVGLSRDKVGVLKLAKEGEIITTPAELIRDPYVFEFLGLKQEERYSESDLEAALLENLQEFLVEMGQGFCLVGRQRRITFDNEHYYIDLLLFNRRLKCLVAIDLMLGPFRHEYAGAMNFYLNYLKAEECEPDEQAPIGLLLCSDKNETHVEYALGGLNNQVFVSRYLLHLPSQEQLEAFVRNTRERLEG